MADPNNVFDRKNKVYWMLPTKVANTTVKAGIATLLGSKQKIKTNSFHDKIWMKGIPVEYRHQKEFTERDDVLKIGFVRNPYDRLLSAWQWVNGQPFRQPQLERFVRRICDETEDKQNIHWKPITYFLCWNGLSVCDVVCHFETLEQDWEQLPIKMPPLEHRNPNKKKEVFDWQAAFTDEMREMISVKYRPDFEMFGYESFLRL